MQKYHDTIIRSDGRAVGGASVTVTIVGGGTPTLYSDDGVTALGSNVLTTDASGEYSFYAANGRYNFAIAATGLPSENKLDVLLHDPADAAAYLVDSGAYYMPAPGTASANSTALLAALQSSAKTIQFDDGVYEFNAVVTHSVAVRTIRGKGAARTTLKMANSHAVDFLLASSAGASATVIEDLTFDGNCTNSTNSYCGLLKADQSTVTTTFTLRDCTIQNVRLYAVRLWPASTDITIERVKFDSCEDTLFEINPWTNGRISDCLFIDYAVLPTYASATGVPLLFYGGSDRWVVTGNRFIPYATTTGQFAIESVEYSSTAMRGSTFANNVFDARNALNGNIFGTGISGYFEGCTFTGNAWRNGSGSAHSCGMEIVGKSNTIVGNTCHNGQFALVAIGSHSTIGNIVANNTFVQNRTAAHPAPIQSDCIHITDGYGVLIESNTFYYEQSHINSGACINVGGATAEAISIRNNKCASYSNAPWINGVKLSVTSAAADCIVEGNYFERLFKAINIDTALVAATHVKRNYYRDCDSVITDAGTSTVSSDNVTL